MEHRIVRLHHTNHPDSMYLKISYITVLNLFRTIESHKLQLIPRTFVGKSGCKTHGPWNFPMIDDIKPMDTAHPTQMWKPQEQVIEFDMPELDDYEPYNEEDDDD